MCLAPLGPQPGKPCESTACVQQAMKEDKAAEPTGDAQIKKEAAVLKGEKADSDIAMKEAKVLPTEWSCRHSVAEQVQAASLRGHFQSGVQ